MSQTHLRHWTLSYFSLITLLLLTACVPSTSVQDTPPTSVQDTPPTSVQDTPPTSVPDTSPTPLAPAPLPLPSAMTLDQYEPLIFDFLENKQYQELGWAYDKRVRDTGPYINGVSYGTHPAVRIFYSPEVYDWLKNGREGDVPDGAMIIKEMFPPPAARYAGLDDDGVNEQHSMWTYMVRDRSGSKDGWFWG